MNKRNYLCIIQCLVFVELSAKSLDTYIFDQPPSKFIKKSSRCSTGLVPLEDDATSALDLLVHIRAEVICALQIHITQNMGCRDDAANCFDDPTNLLLTSVPNAHYPIKFPDVNAAKHLQEYLNDFLRFEYYLTETSQESMAGTVFERSIGSFDTEICPQDTVTRILYRVSRIMPQFDILYVDEVYQYTCDCLAVEKSSDYCVECFQDIPSEVLKIIQDYKFLEQFNAFLNTFIGYYSEFKATSNAYCL